MNPARLYLWIVGLGMVLPGLIAVILPGLVADYYDLQVLSVQGLSQIRAVGGLIVAVGVLMIVAARRGSALLPALDATAVLLLGMIVARVIGVLSDDVEQPKIRLELLIESLALLALVWLRPRAIASTKSR